MVGSIIKRYPGLTAQDVRLQDDGEGIYIAYWKHEKVQPEMSDVLKWHEEDMANYVPPETLEEKAARLELENKKLQDKSLTLSKSVADLFELIMG